MPSDGAPFLTEAARATLAAMERAGGAAFEDIGAPAARASFDADWPSLQLPAAEDGAVSLGPLNFAGAAGAIPALAWRGRGAPRSGARTLLYLHGGGWVVGSPASHANVCRRLADAGDAIVVSPDYRLAPEHRFPAALDDALACLRQLAGQTAELGGAPDRLAVGGDSAGGNLAAVTALLAARTPDLPRPVAQLLFYPTTSAALDFPSCRAFASGYGLTTATMRWFVDCYVRDAGDAADWRVSPLRADPAAGSLPLAPAFVAIAGVDVLRDEGLAYAARLSEAGVVTRTRIWEGHLHGFLNACRYDPAATEAIADAAAFWREIDP